jgi:hypothetical protein
LLFFLILPKPPDLIVLLVKLKSSLLFQATHEYFEFCIQKNIVEREEDIGFVDAQLAAQERIESGRFGSDCGSQQFLKLHFVRVFMGQVHLTGQLCLSYEGEKVGNRGF